jgi:hypothetical protein
MSTSFVRPVGYGLFISFCHRRIGFYAHGVRSQRPKAWWRMARTRGELRVRVLLTSISAGGARSNRAWAMHLSLPNFLFSRKNTGQHGPPADHEQSTVHFRQDQCRCVRGWAKVQYM